MDFSQIPENANIPAIAFGSAFVGGISTVTPFAHLEIYNFSTVKHLTYLRSETESMCGIRLQVNFARIAPRSISTPFGT